MVLITVLGPITCTRSPNLQDIAQALVTHQKVTFIQQLLAGFSLTYDILLTSLQRDTLVPAPSTSLGTFYPHPKAGLNGQFTAP